MFFIHSFYILNFEKIVSADKSTTLALEFTTFLNFLRLINHKLIYF